jgi:hemerythrin-like domain-containing protein
VVSITSSAAALALALLTLNCLKDRDWGIMGKKKKKIANINGIQELSVIDLILIDHRFIKECIETLTDESVDKKEKMNISQDFLEAVETHSHAEKKSVYSPLENNEELHFKVLEAEIEHGIIDQRIKSLRNKLSNVRVLKDELEAELKVVADLVKHHLMEEESELLPRMQDTVDQKTLIKLGASFMKLRKFTAEDLKDYPQLQDELIVWKDSIQKVSSEFLIKMDKFVENLQH